ncbi:MAG: aminodeoxychorismate lyase [Methylovulum sp.]|jgi:4-amino-4-deoxychorismate lyase
MFIINGELLSTINLTDRGLHYGDGLFETLEVVNGKPVFLQLHLERLCRDCQRLLIPAPTIQLLAHEIQLLCTHFVTGEQHHVLKILITRGVGGRGYRQPQVIEPTRIIGLYPMPIYNPDYQYYGVKTRWCQLRLGINPALAGIKHLNRLEQVLARAEWDGDDIQEGIMMNARDNVIEGTMSNLFYVTDNKLCTASLNGSGIAGIMRHLVLDEAVSQGLTVIVHDYCKQALLTADEVFLTNSIIGIWPVKSIDTQVFAIGSVTRRLQALINTRKQAEYVAADF